MECTCPVCGTKHNRSKSEVHHTACSNKCGQRLRFLNLCEKIGKARLHQLYTIEQKGFREIENLTSVCVKTLRKIALHFDIPIRRGSDAVRTQWFNNLARRKTASEVMRQHRREVPWNKGRTKETDTRLRRLSECRTGRGNPSWKDGSTSAYNRLRSAPAHRRWANTVKNRDGRKCTECGAINRLHAHHIQDFRHHPENRYDPSNGITLCHDCHWETHRKLKATTPHPLPSSELPPTLH